MPNAREYLTAMRCPPGFVDEDFGLWSIRVRHLDRLQARIAGTSVQTMLCRTEISTMMAPFGTIVMDDSNIELQRHLPVVMKAKGRVLVTGLGLGCVVRGLLHNPAVISVTVVEIDPAIIERIAPTLPDPRLRIIQGDALKVDISPTARWEFGWHDIHAEEGLQGLHSALILRFRRHCAVQGAWGFPKPYKRLFARHVALVGGQTRRRPETVKIRPSRLVEKINRDVARISPISPAPGAAAGQPSPCLHQGPFPGAHAHEGGGPLG